MVHFSLNLGDPQVQAAMIELAFRRKDAAKARNTGRCLLVMASVLLMLSFFSQNMRTPEPQWQNLLLSLLPIAAAALLEPVQRWLMRRTAKERFPNLVKEYYISDEQVISRCPQEESRLQWSVFQSYGDCGSFFYLMDQGSRALLADKRTLAAEDLKALRKLAEAHIPTRPAEK